jgi:hypothetical protein
MTYQVLSTLKAKTKQGEIILSPGQIINLNPSKADSWIAQGKIKPTSLEERLDSILWESRDKIIEAHKGRQYRANDETRGIEEETDRLYKEVLNGQAELEDFMNACINWEKVVKKNAN